jgi:serine palmitoyltransferase
MKSLELISSGKEVQLLSERVQYLHEALKDLKREFRIDGDPASPLVHLRLHQSSGSRSEDERILQRIVDEIFVRDKIILHCAKYATQHERFLPEPSIRLCICSQHTEEEISHVVNGLKQCALKFLNRK